MILKKEPASVNISPGDGVDNGSLVLTYYIGPFDLPAETSSSKMSEQPGSIRFNMDEPIWFMSFEPTVEDSEGVELPNELVQDIILINHGEENSFCTTKQTGNPFAAATSSMEKMELPEKYGYPILPTDPLEARVVLKNPTKQAYRNVFIKFIITGKKINGASHLADITPMMVDIDPCDHAPISIAPSQFVEKVTSVYAPETGKLVKAYGLLQDYGVSVSISAKDEIDPFWQGIAQIDENYKITGLPPFEDPAGIPVKRGDKLTLTVAYDNCSSSWYDDATGAAMVYLARGEEERVTNDTNESEGGSDNDKKETGPSAVDTQTKLLSL